MKIPENLEKIRQRPCLVCKRPPPSDPHHVKSRGAGGTDEMENLIPLCRRHHVEIHQIGRKTFVKKYSLNIHKDFYDF